MIEIKQLEGIDFKVVYGAFSKAFSDYVEPFDLSYEQLKYMVERRGCDLRLSFGAFDGNELVGFTLNGIGKWNGRLTAYDTGTGIIKEYRKQGIASKMFNESLPILRENNVEQYLLEVISNNKPAYDLYLKAGFQVTREFDYYISTKDKVSIKKDKLDGRTIIKEITNPDWDLLKTFWDFEPSWQNTIDSINRKGGHFKILGAFIENVLVGYGIIEKHTGDITQLAVNKEFKRNGIGSILLKNLFKHSEGNGVKFINTAVECNSFKEFAAQINLLPGIGQYEMTLNL